MRRATEALAVLAALLATPAVALDVCVEGSYPPFSVTEPDGSVTGFDVDIATALCTRLGEPCAFRRTDWARMIPSLVGGDCDAIVASMSDTPERRLSIDFTTAYYSAPVRFVALAGGIPGDSEDEMAGKVVGVQRGTVNQAFMTAHYPRTLLKLYGNQEHVLLDLTLGRLDAILGEAPQLEVGFLKTPAGQGYAFFGAPHFDPALQGTGAAIGVRKEDTGLRDRLNAAIAAIRADGTYEAVERRYFDFDITGGS